MPHQIKKNKIKPNYIFLKLSKICKKSLKLSVQECILTEIGCNPQWGKQQWNLHQGHSWCNCFWKTHLLFSKNSPFFRGPRNLKVVSHCLDTIASKASLTLRWTGHTLTRMGMIHFGIVMRKQQMFPKDWWVEDLCELQIDL